MRIIAGEFRGRLLLPPIGGQTRPVTDRVKQSIFDILAPRIEGSSVYDCFAGTGSFGLEALSRGATRATFFESHRPTAARLNRNIDELGLRTRSVVIQSDIFTALHRPGDRSTDVVFLDPPYRFLPDRSDDVRNLMTDLRATHLAAGAVVVFRHDSSDGLTFSEMHVSDRREYGQMTVEFLTVEGSTQ
jgi:16S rRNA (guanine(966)-N(2))-methyltransferase RsmD